MSKFLQNRAHFWHVLDKDKKPVGIDISKLTDDIMGKHRSVMQHHIEEVFISTVFLGIDHGFLGPPLWFETMIFGGRYSDFQYRYETWEEAQDGHIALTKALISELRFHRKLGKILNWVFPLLAVVMLLIGVSILMILL